MVPKRGLEPPRLAALPPQGSASANFATWAHRNKRKLITVSCTIRTFLLFQVFIVCIFFFEIFTNDIYCGGLSTEAKSEAKSEAYRSNKSHNN